MGEPKQYKLTPKDEDTFKRLQNSKKEQQKLIKVLRSRLANLREEVNRITDKQRDLTIDKNNKERIKMELELRLKERAKLEGKQSKREP